MSLSSPFSRSRDTSRFCFSVGFVVFTGFLPSFPDPSKRKSVGFSSINHFYFEKIKYFLNQAFQLKVKDEYIVVRPRLPIGSLKYFTFINESIGINNIMKHINECGWNAKKKKGKQAKSNEPNRKTKKNNTTGGWGKQRTKKNHWTAAEPIGRTQTSATRRIALFADSAHSHRVANHSVADGFFFGIFSFFISFFFRRSSVIEALPSF